ncbi:ABC transporter ATP-binding protein [Oscillospiraceae bacterium LTW-04]|nr:ABC transporter ATP-binding protein [Oscillospiraceae bacterium MB24-C1]
MSETNNKNQKLFVGGRHGGRTMMATARAKNFKGSFMRLVGFLKPYSILLLVVLLLNIISTAVSALVPKALSGAVNEIARGTQAVLTGTGAGVSMALVGRVLTIIAVMYLLSSAANYTVQYILSGLTQRAMYDLRKRADEKLSRLPLSYFDKNPFGDTLSRVTNDIDTIANSLQQSLNQALSSLLSIVMVFVVMLTISPWLTLAGLGAMPLGIILSGALIKFSQKFFKGQQKSLGELNGYIEETYNGHEVIKAFGREQASRQHFAQLNDALYDYAWKAQFSSGIMMPVIIFITNLGYVVVAIAGGYMITTGNLLVGDIQAMIQYIRQFSHPVSMVANIANILQSAVAAAERVFELLDEPEETPDPVQPKTIANAKGEVRIEDLTFGYGDEPVLKNISVWAKNGQRVAIVGPTGSGKTTLVNLLMRFYEPQQGGITIDGIKLSDMTRAELRSHFGMVLQDTWLFKGSIMENIRYGRLNATDEEVITAAKAACAHRFIRQLPDGYDFELGEDATNISQGQRQLLTIARALLADPDILILDEATSSVDTRTEQLIQNAMTTLMQGRTSFVIAHRLSTIKDADAIIVMKDGEIIERGNHETLLAAGGFYKNLYQSQFAH